MSAVKAAASLAWQARVATDMLGCGRSKVWLDPENKAAISRAKTREDIKELISAGIIIRKPLRVRESSLPPKAWHHKLTRVNRENYWKKMAELANASNPNYRGNSLPKEELERYLAEKALTAEKSSSSRRHREEMMNYIRRS